MQHPRMYAATTRWMHGFKTRQFLLFTVDEAVKPREVAVPPCPPRMHAAATAKARGAAHSTSSGLAGQVS